MPNDITVVWNHSIDNISTHEWTQIHGTDIIKSKSFFKANEEAGFDDVKFLYLQVYKRRRAIAIIPCFKYNIDLLNITSSIHIKKWMLYIRKVFPSYFKFPTFVIGSYAATCEHFIECCPSLTTQETEIVADLIEKEIKKKSLEENAKIVIIKDVRQHSLNYVKSIMCDFRFFVSFPTTAIPILDVPYPNALRKKNRQRYKKIKNKFDDRFYWTIVHDFGGVQAAEFYLLYSAVLTKAKNKFEFLNKNFFELLNRLLDDKVFLLVAKEKNTHETRVMELVLENEEKIIPLYLGIKYKTDDTRILYLNTIFRTVKEAEIRKKDYVDLGQTSYYPKVLSGALVENIYYGFWAKGFFMKFLINHFFSKIFTTSQIPNHVYLAEYAKEAHAMLEKYHLIIEN